MTDMIVNKVAESGLISLDLAEYYPAEEIKIFDLKDYLFRGLILKEKEFRDALKLFQWEDYRNCHAGVVCSAEAIIPPWAYMLVAAYLQPVAVTVTMGNREAVIRNILLKNIRSIDPTRYADQRVVIKGCGDKFIDESAFMEITRILVPAAKTIMYGEPCSTVPIYKCKS